MQDSKVCVVLGAGGFIGGHLSQRLLDQGNSVIGADIKSHEYSIISFTNFFECDLREIENVRKVIPENADEVYQLAADMGGATYINAGIYDADVMSNSILINTNVLKVAVERKVKKIFYSSSACVYPEYNQLEPDNPKCSEDSVYPAEPDTEYGWEKLFSERLYKAFEKQYNLNGFSGENCQTILNVCNSSPCMNGATCNQVSPGLFKCTCLPGYSDSPWLISQSMWRQWAMGVRNWGGSGQLCLVPLPWLWSTTT